MVGSTVSFLLAAAMLSLQFALHGNRYAWMLDEDGAMATLPEDPDSAIRSAILLVAVAAPALTGIVFAGKLDRGPIRTTFLVFGLAILALAVLRLLL